jgi:hypothetical protein
MEEKKKRVRKVVTGPLREVAAMTKIGKIIDGLDSHNAKTRVLTWLTDNYGKAET